MRCKTFLFLLIAAVAQLASAADPELKRSFTFEDMMALKRVGRTGSVAGREVGVIRCRGH